jgi:hypothetical protein
MQSRLRQQTCTASLSFLRLDHAPIRTRLFEQTFEVQKRVFLRRNVPQTFVIELIILSWVARQNNTNLGYRCFGDEE